MEQNHNERVAANILPLSTPGLTLKEALKEWEFTGQKEDLGESLGTCQLRGHEGIRYHYQIANSDTYHELIVGSQCILRFNVAVRDEDGKRLSPAAAKKKLNQLQREMQEQECLKVLEQLYEREKTAPMRHALEYFQEHKKLSPKLAVNVFAKLGLPRNKIPHTPSFFTIELKKKKHQTDLQEMATRRVHFFWRALSAPQRKKAMELGHRAPPGWVESAPANDEIHTEGR